MCWALRIAKALVYYLLRINHVSCLLGPGESQQHLCLVVPDGWSPARVGPAFQMVRNLTKYSDTVFCKLGVVYQLSLRLSKYSSIVSLSHRPCENDDKTVTFQQSVPRTDMLICVKVRLWHLCSARFIIYVLLMTRSDKQRMQRSARLWRDLGNWDYIWVWLDLACCFLFSNSELWETC